MTIYLSLDIDFWMDAPKFYDNWQRECDYIMSRIVLSGITPYIVQKHHKLLPHINANPCDLLINIDYHSDLADDCLDTNRRLLPPLNEGTWGNRVKWRKTGVFHWLCPSIHDCYYQRLGWCTNFMDPFKIRRATTWKKTCISESIWKIKWEHVKAIGISLSKDWTSPEVYNYMMKWHIRPMKKRMKMSI